MPKRTDLKKIMIIGSGPIIIGQACEFDYSGTQACKALKEMGYQIVLVNSNPATIMTDPETADATYIEPLNVERLEKIIEKERPDALLPNLGGQTALNLSIALAKAGVLEKYNVEVIGVNLDAIERGEDRVIFKKTMQELGIDMPKSKPAYTIEEAEAIANELGYPVVIRPAYTLGGSGGGIVYNSEELRATASKGLSFSMVHQVLVEESVLGWQELELEIVRDSKGKKITICFIENVDPMGVHTGDSFCVAPMLTVSQDVQDRLQEQAWRIVESVGVTGGTNVQFGYNKETDRIIIIEINPRASRSSALASKATGFPIAYISAKLAAGMTLDEMPHFKFGTLDKYVPNGDFIIAKFARWAFEKFKGEKDVLGTQMKAVGEVMSVGHTFKEVMHKAIRSLENGRFGLGETIHKSLTAEELKTKLWTPSSERYWQIYEAFRKGVSVDEVYNITKVNSYFLNEMYELAKFEEELGTYGIHNLPTEKLLKAKQWGFSDKYLADILKVSETVLRNRRKTDKIFPKYGEIGVSGVAKDKNGNYPTYYYSTYNADKTIKISDKKKVMVLGSGPNRIGQGIEFDYCCVHAAKAMRDAGYETIMINCNPETVSTDYDTSDKLFFEPLTVEDVLAISDIEKPVGVIVQFGGQTPLNIAQKLEDAGVPIMGTKPSVIAMAEDRDLFKRMMEKLNIKMPPSGMATTIEEAKQVAKEVGYPVMIRPSYVLGGRGMEVVFDDEGLARYVAAAKDVTPDRPLLVDRFLDNALECEADALCDGKDVFVPAIMEHIEQAGVHSGDSAAIIPPVQLTEKQQATIYDYMRKIALELGAVGLVNVQFAVCDGEVYVLEANPRASRTVPIVAKVCGFPMARVATELMNGKSIASYGLKRKKLNFYAVKEAVMPFNKFTETDPLLGPEMKSTGEVMGIAPTFGMAFYKATEGAGGKLPLKGDLLISLNKKGKETIELAKGFKEAGFNIYTTAGTHAYLKEQGIETTFIYKEGQGRPNITDLLINKKLDIIINTPGGKKSKFDGATLRMTAIKYGIAYITTISGALAAMTGIKSAKTDDATPKSLQEYNK